MQEPLSSRRFTRLYNITLQRNASVAKLGARNNGNWNYNFLWQMTLFVWEENLLLNLLRILETANVVEKGRLLGVVGCK